MLEVAGVTAGYGAVDVLQDVNLTVPERGAVTLLGPNGAGKSTLINTLTGLVPRRSGRADFAGQDLIASQPHQIVAAGVVCVPEGRQIFQPMTVTDNLRLGAIRLDRKQHSVRDRLELVFGLFPRLKERRDQYGGTLSGGEQQMLAIGRALMSAPQLLLLDEPFLGLAPLVIEEILRALDRLRDQGVAQLLVEQKSEIALGFAERAYVMVKGRIVLEEDAVALSGRNDLKDIYFAGTGSQNQ